MPITSTMETVTPEQAALWLTRNCPHNRKINPERVASMAEAMRAGQWVDTHQGIAFSPSGILLDGQHRLRAVILAAVPVRLMVARGVPEESFGLLDRGQMRSLTQVCPDIDKAVVQAASYLCRLYSLRVVQQYHIAAVVNTELGEVLARLLALSSQRPAGRFCAPIHAMVALRWFEDSDYIERNWRAYLDLDKEQCSPIVWRMVRQLDSGSVNGRQRQDAKAARAWVAFGPENKYMPDLLVITDVPGILADARKHYQPPWKTEEVAS